MTLRKSRRKQHLSGGNWDEDRHDSRRRTHRRHTAEHFKCKHCRCFIGPLPSGGHHRNHCPFCLYSRHVDDRSPGDRQSTCGSLMQPVGAYQRPKGEHVLLHRCLGCAFERFNRIAADDNFDLVLELPEVLPRSTRQEKRGYVALVEEYLDVQEEASPGLRFPV